jgi:UDP:flavonoid glycosyltransferase YjiC (YdhE family)
MAQGHDVAVATAAAYAGAVETAGLTHLPCGPDEPTISSAFAPAAAEAQELPIPERRPFMFAKRFGEIAAPMTIGELVQVCKNWSPDVVVYDTASLAAPLAAAVVGARSVNHSWGPLFPAAVVANAARTVAPLWKEWGVEPDATAGLYRDLYVDIAPPSMQYAEIEQVNDRILMRPAGYDGASGSSEPVDLPTGDRLIYVTLGTVGLFNGPGMFRVILDGLQDIDANVVLTIGPRNDPADLGEVPPNVSVFQYLPQSVVLQHAETVITHGGAGSVLGAARHGCPQLNLPTGADQFENAQQHASTGAGVFLTPPEVTADAVRSAVRSLLDDSSYQDAADALADEISNMPDPDTAARRLVAALS